MLFNILDINQYFLEKYSVSECKIIKYFLFFSEGVGRDM